MKVLVFMCGEGLGHTSRCISLGRELLSAGHDVYFGAYGYSKELTEKTGYKAYDIPSEITLVGKSGSLDMRGSIKATIKNAQMLGGPKIFRLLSRLKPDFVVSDGYYLGVLGAKAKNIPVYMIVNQTNMKEFFQNRGASIKILGRLAKGFYSRVFERVDKIIIPDFPPPYTICERNLSFSRGMIDRVFFSGPLVRKKYGEVKAEKLARPHVLSMMGGFGYRAGVFNNILLAAKLDDTVNYTLVSGPNVDSKKFVDLPKNVEILKFIENPFPRLAGSDAVIASGGHSTIMEAMSFGVPLLSFPDMFHSEQDNNAALLDDRGYGRRMSYLTPPKVILACIKEVLEDKTFAKKTQRLRKLSADLNGPKALREMMESEL